MADRKIIELPSKAEQFCKKVLRLLHRRQVPFFIGGSLALMRYMDLPRHPKDLDIFLRRQDRASLLALLTENGYRTEVLHEHWLAKIWQGDIFIDVIFGSGNGVSQVDDSWFDCAVPWHMWSVPVKICCPEDLIWSKAFIMDRERFDGADIAHLIRAAGDTINWPRLLGRFGDHWRVLLAHLLLVDFIYPHDRVVPQSVLFELMKRFQTAELSAPIGTRVCRGTLLSRDQYLADIETYGYVDGRVMPNGRLTPEEATEYTSFIKNEQSRKRAA